MDFCYEWAEHLGTVNPDFKSYLFVEVSGKIKENNKII